MNFSRQKLSARSKQAHIDQVQWCMCVPTFACFCTLRFILSVCMCVYAFVRMFVLLKGLAQSRPFVVGSGTIPTQLVWFMDVSQGYINPRPEKDCPLSWCETPTKVPALTALNRNWYKHKIWLKGISRCLSISSYINAAQKETGAQIKIPAWENMLLRLIWHDSSRCHALIYKSWIIKFSSFQKFKNPSHKNTVPSQVQADITVKYPPIIQKTVEEESFLKFNWKA